VRLANLFSRVLASRSAKNRLGAGELFFEPENGLAWRVVAISEALPEATGDSMDGPSRSSLKVLEDGVPLPTPHEPHEEIRSLGRGRFSHWGDYLLFSPSDNSNPATNGRRYAIEWNNRRVQLAPASYLSPKYLEVLERDRSELRARASEVNRWLRHVNRYCWSLDLAALCNHCGIPLSPPAPQARIFEDGEALSRAAESPSHVAIEGSGAVFQDNTIIFFAASDNSNVKLNGRSYEVELQPNVRLPIPPSVQAIALGPGKHEASGHLVELVNRAYESGQNLNLNPETHGLPAADYYRFLGGLLRVTNSRRIVEIGTDQGGSAYAMAQAIGSRLDLLVTADLVDRTNTFPAINGLERVIGDAAGAPTIHRILELCEYRPVDILFVDSAHEYASTAAHFSIYSALLRPRLVVLDDIVLSETMASLWADLRRVFGAAAVNACDIEPRVRTPECGFGVIDRGTHTKRA
jgi:predicted O-methyltransferase YrrM